jgi:thymidine phosphorylase
MDEPLAPVAGNALEVANAIANLKAPVDSRLDEVTFALGAEIMVLAGLATSRSEALSRLARARDSGEAAERFARMVRRLGGPGDLLDRPERHLAAAPVVVPVVPDRRGHVAAIDTRALGLAVIGLGGGRRLTSDAIDYAVGLSALAGIGAEVGPKSPLALVHARTEAGAAEAVRIVTAAYALGEPRRPAPVVRETVSAGA